MDVHRHPKRRQAGGGDWLRSLHLPRWQDCRQELVSQESTGNLTQAGPEWNRLAPRAALVVVRQSRMNVRSPRKSSAGRQNLSPGTFWCRRTSVKKDFGGVLPRWKSCSALKLKFSRDVLGRHSLLWFTSDLSTIYPAYADRSRSAARRQDGQVDGVLRREVSGEVGDGMVRIQRSPELNRRDVKRTPRCAAS